MADITRRRNGEFLRGAMQILAKHDDGIQARHVLHELERVIGLTPYESGFFDSGGRRFDAIARFATVGAVKAGWILKQKGRWSITAEGRSAVGAYPDPEVLFREADRLYQSWRKSQPDETPADGESDREVAVEGAAIKLEEAEESSWAEVEAFVQAMNPYDFQDLVGAVLRAMGYYVVWTAPPGRDGGVDLVAAPDPLGTRSPRIKVQVKRQLQPITVDGLRSFLATLGSDDVGLYVSMGGFTKGAQDEARLQPSRKVTLIDLERLFDLWVEHSPKLPDVDRRRLPLRPVWFLALE